MDSPLVTVVTSTTGDHYLEKALQSVKTQTYQNIEHYVIVDGAERQEDALKIIKDFDVKLLTLPYATGKDGYNGHRNYAAATYLSSGEYIAFLDEDNYYESTHIQSCVEQMQHGNQWVYSLRNIVDASGNFVCKDDCESLGKWKSVLNDNFVDVGCWFFSKKAALTVSPLWYRRARHPQDQPEVDRIITATLVEHFPNYDCTGQYTFNYRVSNKPNSVKAEFFIQGNARMQQVYGGNFPWRKTPETFTITF